MLVIEKQFAKSGQISTFFLNYTNFFAFFRFFRLFVLVFELNNTFFLADLRTFALSRPT